MIEARSLVKRYDSTMAVNDLSFSIRLSMVTGFLLLAPLTAMRHSQVRGGAAGLSSVAG
jgi:hypothetical protein